MPGIKAIAPDLLYGPWQILALVALVFGPPPVLTMVARGVIGLMIRGASIGRGGFFIGLVLGVIGSAASFGAMIAALVLVDGIADEWVSLMLPIVATVVVFAAATALLTWRMRERPPPCHYTPLPS